MSAFQCPSVLIFLPMPLVLTLIFQPTAFILPAVLQPIHDGIPMLFVNEKAVLYAAKLTNFIFFNGNLKEIPMNSPFIDQKNIGHNK